MNTDRNNDKPVLVTGASGFIGSHLTEALVHSGRSVRCLLRYGSSGDLGFLSELPAQMRARLDVRRGDLLDGEFVANCCDGVDTVFHLGARISIPYSYVAPRDTFQVNALGTLNVIEAVRRAEVRRLVHVSTSEVFGSAVSVPMNEDHRLKAQSPYAASKIAADKLVESYVCSFGLPAVIVRPFNTFGPRQSPRAVISTILDQALRGGPVRLGSLWPRRDFTFVDDTVQGFIRAAWADAAQGEEFNLGTGHDVSIGALAETIGRLLDTSLDIVADDSRQRPSDSEVNRLLSDNSKARRILGWEPQVSLEEGLRRTITWWRNRSSSFAWENDAI